MINTEQKYKIEKNIPPPLVKDFLQEKADELKEVLCEMQIGDSIVLEDDIMNKVMPVVKKMLPFEFVSKRVEGDFLKRRYWRIK